MRCVSVFLASLMLLAAMPLAATAETAETEADSAEATLPEPVISRHAVVLADGAILDYEARAGWLTIREAEEAVAAMFYTAYRVDPPADATSRPVTFVFNGGPGASSVYLHMGALGPRRVLFDRDGGLPQPPVRLADNPHSWLAFTDLVFIDPVGTGYSHMLPGPDGERASEDDPEPPYEVDRDLQFLGLFIQRFLTETQSWTAPVFIAGESYGGLRVAALARMLPGDFGVALNGAVLISPAMTYQLLLGGPYDVLAWAMLVPSYAAAALEHETVAATDREAHLAAAETFALDVLLPALAKGGGLVEGDREDVYQRYSALTGLPVDIVARHNARVPMRVFARELLRSEGRVLGLYDASLSTPDPMPAAARFRGIDPTLEGTARVFGPAIRSHLGSTLGVTSERTYEILSYDVFRNWEWSERLGEYQGFIQNIDRLQAAIAGQDDLHVLITHGLFDLVTPYFTSDYAVDQMFLPPAIQQRVTLKRYRGGHMYYTHEDSLAESSRDAARFYRQALEPKEP